MAKDVNLTSQEWCDIIFEGKNVKYGACKIRRNSSKRHWIALLAVVLIALFVAFLPTLIKTVVAATRSQSEGLTESAVLAELKELEEEPEAVVHEQEALPPPPLKSTIKFTAPVITSSEEMNEDDGMKSQDELTNTKLQISTQDIQGTDEEHGVDIADLKEHKAIVQEKKEEVFRFVQQMPEFPGGKDELYAYIRKNIQYPSAAREYQIEGTVVVEFIVNKDGRVGNATVVVNPHPLLAQEALRVVKAMPKWVPGKQNGQAVSTYFTLPIIFQMNK